MATANDDATATGADVLESAIDALYRGPRERFVTERNGLAKRLRAEGRSERAAWVKGLTKPSVSAWAVAQLWWTRRDEVIALQQAGARLRAMLHRGAGPAQQAEANREQRRIRDRLVDAAKRVLTDAGHAATPSTLRKISTSLEALAAHGPHGGPHPGRLTEDLAPPGFDLLTGPFPPGPVSTDSDEPSPAEVNVDAADRAAVEAAERALVDARDRAQDAARALDEITRDAEAAVLEAQRADEEHEQAVLAARRANQAAEAAMLAARRARADAGRLHERLRAAQRTAAELAAEQRRLEQELRQLEHRD